MLLPEQYLVIYFITYFLSKDKKVRYLCSYITICFLLDEIVRIIFKSSYEFIIISYLMEIIIGVVFISYCKSVMVRSILFLIVIGYLFHLSVLTSINFLLYRDDIISYFLYEVSSNLGYFLNEIIISFLLIILSHSYKYDARSLSIYLVIITNYISLILL
jgi:hypothetical protein